MSKLKIIISSTIFQNYIDIFNNQYYINIFYLHIFFFSESFSICSSSIMFSIFPLYELVYGYVHGTMENSYMRKLRGNHIFSWGEDPEEDLPQHEIEMEQHQHAKIEELLYHISTERDMLEHARDMLEEARDITEHARDKIEQSMARLEHTTTNMLDMLVVVVKVMIVGTMTSLLFNYF